MQLLFLFCLFRRSGSSNPDFPTYWWAFFRVAAFRMNTALFPFRHQSQVWCFIATRFSSSQRWGLFLQGGGGGDLWPLLALLWGSTRAEAWRLGCSRCVCGVCVACGKGYGAQRGRWLTAGAGIRRVHGAASMQLYG